MTRDKLVGSAAEAVADIPDGASLAVGDFGLAGIPWFLIEAVLAPGGARSDASLVERHAQGIKITSPQLAWGGRIEGGRLVHPPM